MEIKIDENDIERIAGRVHSMLQEAPKSQKQQENRIMDVGELASFLRVAKSWIYKQIQFKSIPHFHAGKYPRFKRMDIERWISDNSMPSTCQPYPKMRA